MERREGMVELRAAFDELKRGEQKTVEDVKEIRKAQQSAREAAIRADTKIDGLTTIMKDIAPKIDSLAAEAVLAASNRERNDSRVDKLEESHLTMGKLVAVHDADIRTLKNNQKPKTPVTWQTWAMVASTVTLVFALYWFDSEAASGAVEAAKGIFRQ